MKDKGFTLIELVTVVVIVSILAIVAVPIYRRTVRNSMAAEGQILVGSVAKAEFAYYAEHGQFHHTSGFVGYDPVLDIDAR